MSRLPEADMGSLGSVGPLLDEVRDAFGSVPTSFAVMAHRPDITQAFLELRRRILSDGTVDLLTKRLAALATSFAAGCRYCQAHTALLLSKAGVESEKITALWNFEESSLFDDGERAVVRFAMAAGSVPNAVSDELVDDVVQHFGVVGAVEIASVCGLFGFLNRWNDSLSTLEDHARTFAEELLPEWRLGP